MTLISTVREYSAYQSFKRELRSLRRWAESSIDRLAASDISSTRILDGYSFMGDVRRRLAAYAAMSTLADQAKAAEMDATYDVQAQIALLDGEVNSTMSWIETNFPSSGGYLDYVKIADEKLVYQTFSPGQTAGLRTQLQTIVDRING